MNYDELKKKHPELNWAEAEEADPEELEAAAELFDRIATQKRHEALLARSPKSFSGKLFRPTRKNPIRHISFAGYVESSFAELVSLFGLPNSPGDNYKTSTECVLEYEKGQFAKIYDYKETILYSRSMESVDKFRRRKLYGWHIAATTVATSNALLDVINTNSNEKKSNTQL